MKVATQPKGSNSKRITEALRDVLERYEEHQCSEGCGRAWKDCRCPDGKWFREARAMLPKAQRKSHGMSPTQCDYAHTTLTELGNTLQAQGVDQIELLEYYRAWILSIIDCNTSFKMSTAEKRRYLDLKKRVGG